MSSSPPRPLQLRTGVVVQAITICKLLLYLTGVSDTLAHDQQLSSPLTSYFHLREGVHLFKNGADPYDGGSFHHSPLLLALFGTVIPPSKVAAYAFWCLCDAMAAGALVSIWHSRQRVSLSSRDTLIALTYLLNPYLLLPSLALSTSTIDNTLTLFAIKYACQGRRAASLLCLALVIHMSPSMVLILAPTLLVLISDPHSHLASPQPFQSPLKRAIPLLGQFLLYFVALTAASSLAAGNISWILQTWGVNFTLPDLSPNPGMWWYFFTEMFDHFRPFFLMVFSVHLLIYIAPVCLKFQHDPLYAAFLLLGVIGTFKSYLTLSDPGLFLSMISLFPETYPYQSTSKAYGAHISNATMARANLRAVLKETKRTDDNEKDYLRIVKILDEYVPLLRGIMSCVAHDEIGLKSEPEYAYVILTYAFAVCNLARSSVKTLGLYEHDRTISDSERKAKDEKLNLAVNLLMKASGMFSYISQTALLEWDNSRDGGTNGLPKPPDLSRVVNDALEKYVKSS
ncbi:hypothetical protein ONZ45_g1512 [Pleurotus djamor]|nr:hypothetical protein ONZ45_g1512 [Pleurotus djamor]